MKMHSRDQTTAHCRARGLPHHHHTMALYRVASGVAVGSTSIFPPPTFKIVFCTIKVQPAFCWSEVSAIRIFDLYYCESSQRWPERDPAAKRVVANKTLQSLDLGWIGSELSTKENFMQT